MKVTLYTQTHCPNCKGIKRLLENKNIEIEEVQDVDLMLDLGIKSVPMMDIGDGNLMNLYQITEWIKTI